jgi:hypothetical protein
MPKVLRFVRPTSFEGIQYPVGTVVSKDTTPALTPADIENLTKGQQVRKIDDKIPAEKIKPNEDEETAE